MTMVAPGMIPTLPPPVPGSGMTSAARRLTNCQTGIVDSDALIQIALGIMLAPIKRWQACIPDDETWFNYAVQLHELYARRTTGSDFA